MMFAVVRRTNLTIMEREDYEIAKAGYKIDQKGVR